VARAALAGGATIIQLRDKTASTRRLLEIAQTIRRLTWGINEQPDQSMQDFGGGVREPRQAGFTKPAPTTSDEPSGPKRQAKALFIVNDRLDVALAAEADGVHVGQDDLPVEIARKIAGGNFIIGASSATLDEARRAAAAGADYLGIGTIFPTDSKADTGPALGLEILGQIKQATNLPVIAIGGITGDNAPSVLEAGADGLAVISAITGAPDMVAATRNLVTLIEKFRA
jgi:thiamine-phosphate diphosphorylase